MAREAGTAQTLAALALVIVFYHLPRYAEAEILSGGNALLTRATNIIESK
jgi:hypothetical protein